MSRTQFHFFYYANKINTVLIVGTKKKQETNMYGMKCIRQVICKAVSITLV